MLRQEVKFINEVGKSFLKSTLISKLYEPRYVYSIYYDTYDYKFYRLSEEGISPRFKVRIRSYNKNFQNKNLEIKITSDYYREKKSQDNIDLKSFSLKRFLVKNGINEVIKPVLLVSYFRYYFKSKIGRITYDREIQYNKVSNSLQILKPTFYDKERVIEIKNNNIKFNKYEILKKTNLKESRFSKYCRGVEQMNIY